MDSDLAWVNGKSGRQSWCYADAFQCSIISEAIYQFSHLNVITCAVRKVHINKRVWLCATVSLKQKRLQKTSKLVTLSRFLHAFPDASTWHLAAWSVTDFNWMPTKPRSFGVWWVGANISYQQRHYQLTEMLSTEQSQCVTWASTPTPTWSTQYCDV